MRRRTLLAGIAVTGLAAPLLARGRDALRPLARDDFTIVAQGLDRPECVAVGRDGRLFVSTMDAAIAIREPGGAFRPLGTPGASTGVALDRRERVVIANMGLLNGRPGTLERLDPVTGVVETLAAAIGGRALVASNAPAIARDGTIYCTHSSWGPVQNIGTTDPAGFVYSVAPDGSVRTVAQGLRGANGCCLDRHERFLYVSLTAAGTILRFPRRRDGSLGPGEQYGPVLGTVVPDQMVAQIVKLPRAERATLGYADNIAFDAAGNLWICLPFANRIVALTPDRRLVEIAHDPEGRRLSLPTALAWGGPDLRDLYIVSRGSGMIVTARTPVAGLTLVNQREAG
ncbi:MAG: SMP-30/gluconolactonase/LRE family protein [Pseudomonadota bacterium]